MKGGLHVFLLWATIAGAAAYCDLGEGRDPWLQHQTSCYYIAQTRMNLNDSVAACRAMGATLTSVLDTAETEYLLESIGCLDKNCTWETHQYWIGLVKDSGDKNNREGWRWLDGSTYSWQNWANSSSEPNNDSGATRMRSDGRWYDYTSTDTFGCICKKAIFHSSPSSTSDDTTLSGAPPRTTLPDDLTTATDITELPGDIGHDTYLYVGVGIAVIVVTIIVVVTAGIILRRRRTKAGRPISAQVDAQYEDIRIVDNRALVITPTKGHVTYTNTRPGDDVGDYEEPYQVLKTDVYVNGPGSNAYADLTTAT